MRDGHVREQDLVGNDGADEAADSGRGGVELGVTDAGGTFLVL